MIDPNYLIEPMESLAAAMRKIVEQLPADRRAIALEAVENAESSIQWVRNSQRD